MLYYRGRQRIEDANGDGVSNAKVSFYLTGTSTPAPVYADADLTVEHTNPVRTNAAGYLPPIYLDPSVTYKSVETDANDVSLPGGTVDPIPRAGPGYEITGAETLAALTIIDYEKDPGDPERYQVNTTPGTTNMAAGLTAANAQSIQAGGYPITPRSVLHIGSAVTISGPFEAPLKQVFTVTSNVTFTSIRDIYAEWFGAKSDAIYNNFVSGTDNTAAVNKAIASIPAGTGVGGAVRFGGKGTYRFGTALTLRDDLSVIGVESGIPWGRMPILQYGGSGIFMDVNYQRVSLIGFQVFGNNVSGAGGIRIADQHNCAENIVVSQFDDGAGSIGFKLAPAATKQTLYFRGRNIWVNSCSNGFQVGDGVGGTVNANTVVNLILSGNGRNGLLINGCTGLNIIGLDSEGNVTGGTGANVNIVAGKNIDITGYTEISAETGTKKNIILPAGSVNAHNIFLRVQADGALGTNFTSEDVYTYYHTNPRQVANDEPPRYTNISVNALSAYDPGQNVVTPILQSKNGPVVLGAVKDAVGSSWPNISMRNSGSVANNATIDLTAFMKGQRTAVEGLLFIQSDQDNAGAIFNLKNSTTVEYMDPATKFSATATTANMTNVYWDTDHYELENKTGGARNYSMHLLMG